MSLRLPINLNFLFPSLDPLLVESTIHKNCISICLRHPPRLEESSKPCVSSFRSCLVPASLHSLLKDSTRLRLGALPAFLHLLLVVVVVAVTSSAWRMGCLQSPLAANWF